MNSQTRTHLITDRSIQLIQDLKTYREISIGIQVAKLYETSKRSLTSGLRRLDRVAKSAAAMRESEIEFPAIEIGFGQFSQLISEIKDEAGKSVADAVQSDAFASLVTHVEALAAELETRTRVAWAAHVRSCSPSGGAAINLFEALGMFTKEIEDLRTAGTLIGRVDTDDLPTPEEITAFTEAVTTYSDALAELSTANLPVDVRSFLEDAIDDGAKLTDLSPVILEWIERHKIAESFRVIID